MPHPGGDAVTGFRVQVMTPEGEWLEVTDPADPILAKVGEDFRARATARPVDVDDARVICRGCDATVGMLNAHSLGGLLSDHDRDCATHSWDGCTHDGVCYEKAGTTALLASARVPELENRSQS